MYIFHIWEAGDIGYLNFRISEDSPLEKWPNYPELPYTCQIGEFRKYMNFVRVVIWKSVKVIMNADILCYIVNGVTVELK